MPTSASQNEVEALDRLSDQVQALQLQVEKLNSNLSFDSEALQLGLYYSVSFFVTGLIFGLVAAMIRRSSK